MTRQASEEFFLGCGAKTPLELQLTPCVPDQPLGKPKMVVMESPFAVVGRSRFADLTVKDPGIARRHCYLQAFGPRMLCVDLGIQPSLRFSHGPARVGWIGPGRGVLVGNHLLSLPDGTGQPPTMGAPDDPDSPPDELLVPGNLPRIVLEFQAGPLQSRWPMKRALALIGRAHECGVRLSGPTVSRFHGAFVRTTTGLWVIDLLGAIENPGFGGITLNGDTIRVSRIAPDDRLEIGPFQVRAHYAGMPRRHVPTFPLALANPSNASLHALSSSDEAAVPAQLVHLIEDQAAEIASLRRDVDELRELAEELRGTMKHPERLGVSGQTVPTEHEEEGSPGSEPRRTSVRTLGKAVQSAQPEQPDSATTNRFTEVLISPRPAPGPFTTEQAPLNNPFRRSDLPPTSPTTTTTTSTSDPALH